MDNYKFISLLIFIFLSHLTVACSDDVSSDNKESKPIEEIKLTKHASCLFYDGSAIHINTKFDGNHDLRISFSKCMFNELMTFSKVGLIQNQDTIASDQFDKNCSIIINEATSDNIGPVNINGHGWFGGNHSFQEKGALQTAQTLSYKVFADGQSVKKGSSLYAKSIVINVINTLFDPTSVILNNDVPTGFNNYMCTEYINYYIQEGNIEVEARHVWNNASPFTIMHYYGMQSMAKGDEIFFPNGNMTDFISKRDGIQESFGKCSDFDRFIQRNAKKDWYESALLFKENLGLHTNISTIDFVYLVSYGKVYHHLLSNKDVYKGLETKWHGIYSYIKPIVDTDLCLAYVIKTKDAYQLLIDIKKGGSTEFALPDKIQNKEMKVIQNNQNLKAELINQQKVRITADKPGSIYCTFSLLSQ